MRVLHHFAVFILELLQDKHLRSTIELLNNIECVDLILA